MSIDLFAFTPNCHVFVIPKTRNLPGPPYIFVILMGHKSGEAAKLPANVEVLTISCDLPFAQARFVAQPILTV